MLTKHWFLIPIVFFSFLIISCNNHGDTEMGEAMPPMIIPMPQQMNIEEGAFVLSEDTRLEVDDEFKVSEDFLTTYLEEGSGIVLKKEGSGNSIILKKSSSIENPEGYNLKITPSEIIITAADDRGAFYGVQTLRQLLSENFENNNFNNKKTAISCLSITDAPAYSYRGMHLDVGRHFFSVDFIKKYIDALAMLKMNTFHWHLTEDQGWRIEIKKYPKLNEVAAYRNETLIGHYNESPQKYDGKKYGGFYTQDEIKEIVAYAASRHITVIPEIEMPGHAQAAIAAYPHLGCDGEAAEVATKWGVFDHIYCAKDSTFAFLEDVLDEVLPLFPSKYIHIGGDEAPKTRWKTCADCQQRIKENNLKDEHGLQSYFIARVEKYLNSKGRQIIGWDEILEGGLAPNATVMSWRGIDGAVAAAKEKHNVILSPTSHCYFDYYQSTNESEPLAIGGFLPLDKVYGYKVMPAALEPEEQQYVLGAQANVWTEYMTTTDKVEYMVFPRILAMSEVVWSGDDKKDYPDFVKRLEHFQTRLKALDINFANHLYEIEADLQQKDGYLIYELSTLTDGKTIRYTLDDTTPSLTSSVYAAPIKIDKSCVFKAAVFDDEKQLGTTFSKTINFHKAVGKDITLSVPPAAAYNAGGMGAIINGMSGSDERYGDKDWLGFSGKDVTVTIDLGNPTEIKSLSTRFHNGKGQWIYAPKEVAIQFDDQAAKKFKIPSSDETMVNFDQEFEKITTQKIIFTIPSYGVIPDGLQGGGHRAWTFVDEIVVK